MNSQKSRPMNMLKSKAPLSQIKASAGSGKTWALTMKYMRRLAEIPLGKPSKMAAQASGILAITFTNAAANEMRERVIKELKLAALDKRSGNFSEVISQEAAKRWLDIFLRNMDALNIRTIDSLLHKIARSSALDLAIAPDYETEFDVREALWPEVEKSMNASAMESRERDLLVHACQALLAGDNSKGFAGADRIENQLIEVLEGALTGKYKDIAQVQDFELLWGKMRLALRDKAARLVDFANHEHIDFAGNNGNTIRKYAQGEVNKSLPTFAKTPCSSIFKGDVSPAIADAFRQLCEYAKSYHGLIGSKDQIAQLAPIIHFANSICARFIENQRVNGTVIQAQIADYAASALHGENGVSEALCRMSVRLTHYLIDEFQDTSRVQWDVLQPLIVETLSRGGTLTWVGDIKQSIYAWRGGDSTLFDEPLNDAELNRIAPIVEQTSLKVNRRSFHEIVKHNNKFFLPLSKAENIAQIFSPILTPEAIQMLTPKILSAYEGVEQDTWEEKDAGGFVSFESNPADTADNTRKNAAEWALKILDEKIKGRRPWSDVMILVRGEQDSAPIIEALSSAEIPVITEKGLLLAENALIIQLVAFLETIFDRKDSAAFYAVLKGSILNSFPQAKQLTETNLAAWAAACAGKSLRKKFSEDFPELWNNIFLPFYSKKGLFTPYDLIREWCQRLQVEDRFPEDMSILRRFYEVLHLLENQGITTPAAFLDYWREKGLEEKAPMPERMNAVRVMTIHKAKGLQAPVVIIPSTMYGIKTSGKPVPVQAGNEMIAVKLKKEMGEPYDDEMAMQALEAINLLYVAMTRAEEELYIHHTTNRQRTRTLDRVLDGLLTCAGLQDNYDTGTLPERHYTEEEIIAKPKSAQLEDATQEDWRPMDWLPRIRIFRRQYSGAKLSAKERGILMHSALENLNYDPAINNAAQNALDMAIRESGLNVAQDVRESLIAGINWLLGQKTTRDWMENGLPEHSMLDAEGNELRVDLIVPREYGPLIIDYKTGEASSEHVEQIRAYMQCLENSGQFRGKPKGLIIYLDLNRFCLVDGEEVSELSDQLPQEIN